jgi:hypothetical protein
VVPEEPTHSSHLITDLKLNHSISNAARTVRTARFNKYALSAWSSF